MPGEEVAESGGLAAPDLVARGVGTGVARTQSARQRLTGVGQEAQQGVEDEAALACRRGLLLLGVASDQRGAARTAGMPPSCSAACIQATSRARARVERRETSVLPSASASSRQAVGVAATEPNTPAWSRSTARSAMASPPSASITARSVAIRPRSCPVPRSGRSGPSAVEYATVGPVASAISASIRTPA